MKKMKKTTALLLALLISAGTMASLLNVYASSNPFTPEEFFTWLREEEPHRSPVNQVPANDYTGGFVTDPAGRPSYEDLETILNFASLASSAGGSTSWYMVAVTDPDTQFRIGQHETQGTPRANQDGTVMVLIFTESAVEPQFRTEGGRDFGFNPRIGYTNVGLLSAYLNLAAISLGYSTRMFMTMRDPWPAVGHPWLELQHFLDGEYFVWGSTGDEYSAENMKFAQAIVIGTMDHDVVGGATVADRPNNWSFWSPNE